MCVPVFSTLGPVENVVWSGGDSGSGLCVGFAEVACSGIGLAIAAWGFVAGFTA